MKGKTSPCGCHIPKGGLARRASFGDSIRREYSQVLVVDGGNFFPENDDPHYGDDAVFLMDAMKLLGTDAVGIGEHELRYGFSFLKVNATRIGTPVVCANLLMKASGKPAFAPYLIRQVGSVKVGIFGLMSDKVAYGPSADSLTVEEPTATARRVLAEMKKKGATVTVLLSQLGKVESEDLAASVDGIDALIIGHASTLLMKGRVIKNTVACYGGEQAQYMGRTILTLDAAHRQTAGECDVYMMGPEVVNEPGMLKLVKSFEDGFNEKMRKIDQETAAKREAAKGDDNPDRFLGAELCVRCHESEGEQWKTTAHALAWQTLVDAKKDATPECVTCHVVGYRKPGGFAALDDAARLGNVQCENCHGMGTMHDSFPATRPVVREEVCADCHQGEHDPEWNWEKKRAMIVHSNMTGESVRSLQHNMGRMNHGGQ